MDSKPFSFSEGRSTVNHAAFKAVAHSSETPGKNPSGNEAPFRLQPRSEYERRQRDKYEFKVMRDYFAKLGVPVVANFPVGHVRYHATLPVGVFAELDTDTQSLRLLEDPVKR